MASEQAADNFHHANLVYPYTKFNLPCAARGPDNPHRLIFRGFVDERTIINAEHILQAETVNVPVEQPPLRYPVMRQPPPRLVQPPPARGVQQPPVRGVQPPPARGVRPPQV
ncbi:uncharacterized protein [Clytia hemisphaerica]|uniref:uncharacterized protein n=1 Tax=Clytia hemisphaerica TaxID=252671 RepID=UPI0034D76886